MAFLGSVASWLPMPMYADVRYIDDVISHSVGTTSHTLALTKMCGMTASDGPPLQRTGPLLLKRWMLCVESLA